jgi:hypothetical protein
MEIIKEILSDIYNIDSSLKKYEPELIKIIKTMLDSRPKTETDEQFKEKLRIQLFQKIEQLKQKNMSKENNLKYYLPKLAYAFSGALLLALILFPIMLQLGKITVPIEENLEENITEKQNEAFGPLSIDQEQLNLVREGDWTADTQPGIVPEPSKSGLDIEGQDELISVEVGEIDSIRPPRYSYRYVYKGEDFSLENSMVKVFKRIIDSKSSVLNNFVNRLDLGLIDLNKFSDLEVNNINFAQESDDGYNFYIDFNNGNISIHKKPENYLLERGEMLTLEDKLSDAEIIGISNNFLDIFGIDKSGFGSPIVEHSGPEYHIMDEEKIISEYVQVTYPLILDGKTVYNQSGNEYGLSVTVNIREKEVNSVYNLFVQKYETSLYKAITDKEEAIKQAEKGGLYGYYIDETGETKEIPLGTPSVGYMRFMNYKVGKSDELYTPALIFPIGEIPDGVIITKENVVVPLAKDLLKKLNYPMPVPLLDIEEK